MSNYSFMERQFSEQSFEKYGVALAETLGVSAAWLRTGEGDVLAPVAVAATMPRVASGNGLMPRLSPTDLARLGGRARMRRKDVGVSRFSLHRELGISLMTMSKWEQQLPSVRRETKEMLWEGLLQVPVGWLRDESLETPPVRGPSVCGMDAIETRTVADEIRCVGAWLSRPKAQKRTFNIADLNPDQRRHADVFALRYGVEGEEASILACIGERYGVTRERIRQICYKMGERAQLLETLATPLLDQLIGELRPHLPMLVEEVDARFRHLLGERLSIACVGRFAAEVLGRRVVTVSENATGLVARSKPSVIDPNSHDAETIRAIRDGAMSMVRSIGAANTYVLAGQVSEERPIPISPRQVISACKICEGFSWLAEKDGWFWFGPDIPLDNHLLSVVRKVLAAAGQRVDVEDIQQACCRSRRPWVDEARRDRPSPVELPTFVISAALLQAPWLRCVQKNDFEFVHPVAIEDVVSPTELLIYREIVAAGGICRRFGLYDALVKNGKMLAITFQQTLGLSPIFAHLDFAVFAIRGWPWGDQSALFDSQPRPDGKRLVSVDPATDELSFRYELTHGATRNRLFYIPSAACTRLEPGEYRFLDGECEFAVTVSRSRKAGLRVNRLISAILAAGVKVGEPIDVSIHPANREIRYSRVSATRVGAGG